MRMRRTTDAIDIALLTELQRNPDATAVAIAERTGLSRNTVRARIQRYADEALLHPFDRRIPPAFLGYPLRAYLFTVVTQRKLAQVADALAGIPEVIWVDGVSGRTDLVVHVVARDADDLYRVAGSVLAIDGVKRTDTGLVMQEFVVHRVLQLANAPTR